MMQKITVSAPYKIHLLGEHVVVYNKPALLAAVDKRCTVSLSKKSGNMIEISTNLTQESKSVTLQSVIEKTKKAREMWSLFEKTKDMNSLSLILQDVFDYIEIAIGETFLYYKKFDADAFSLHIESTIPVGSGMGSSAALAVSVSGAIAKHLGQTIDKDDIFSISYEIEKRRHGLPSGGDPAVVLHGGIIWFEKDKKMNIQPIKTHIPQRLSESFFIVNTGTPTESTGEMINLVSQFRSQNPKRAEELFDQQEKLTGMVKRSFEEEDIDTLQYCLTQAQRNLEELGVVSKDVIDLVSQIEKTGGSAKISGAGGRRKGSGIIVVYTTEKQKMKEMLAHYSLDFYNVKLGAKGLSFS